ncbi:MAG: hypothetical protein JRG96_17205 [Deltaproteobacteria bacterium]|nr:hypothetical protein [Deltaproteobacteria bacterium]MBW2416995.1 hypothetical protein [Deltaproteobacteria bacterium]
MGGFGSGRIEAGGRRVVDDALIFDIDRLKRRGELEPYTSCFGSWVWYERPSGRRLATVGYELDTEATYGTLRLRYTVSSRRRAGSLHRDYVIDLVTTRPHFGGLRWWFRCPVSGRRVRKVYAHPGSSYFASREALGLTYQVCREEPLDGAARRARKRAARLGVFGPLSEPLWLTKPKGMHWTTFSSLAVCTRREVRHRAKVDPMLT